MGYDIRKPMITAPTAEGQLLQIKSYLIQLVDQLGFALNDITNNGVTSGAETGTDTARAEADPDLETRLNAFKSLITGGSVVDTMLLGKKLTAAEGAEVDLDDLRTPGCYYSPDGANIVNSPATEGFRLEVKLLENDETILQTVYYAGTEVSRHFDGSEWSAWLHADFVTEKGQSGGWTYRKWKGGTYEMYGTFELTPTSSELNGTLYRTNDIEVPTPFEITDDAVVTGMGAENYILTNGVYANANAISIRIMCDKEIGTTDPIKVRLNVIGTYAQTEV